MTQAPEAEGPPCPRCQTTRTIERSDPGADEVIFECLQCTSYFSPEAAPPEPPVEP